MWPSLSTGALALPRERRKRTRQTERALAEATLPLGTAPREPGAVWPSGLDAQPLLGDDDQLDIAATYVPADDRPVGGDWYDAFRVDRDTVALTIGDACGHGVEAAGLSAQVRNATRALTFHGVAPAPALHTTSRVVASTTPEDFATCILLRLHRPSGRLAWGRAGHPPPLLRREGAARVLNQGGGVPVGVYPDSEYREAQLDLRSGDLLVLYTDGLIEHPGTPLDRGIERLRRLIEVAGERTAADLNNLLRTQLVDTPPRDDVCIVAVRMR